MDGAPTPLERRRQQARDQAQHLVDAYAWPEGTTQLQRDRVREIMAFDYFFRTYQVTIHPRVYLINGFLNVVLESPQQRRTRLVIGSLGGVMTKNSAK